MGGQRSAIGLAGDYWVNFTTGGGEVCAVNLEGSSTAVANIATLSNAQLRASKQVLLCGAFLSIAAAGALTVKDEDGTTLLSITFKATDPSGFFKFGDNGLLHQKLYAASVDSANFSVVVTGAANLGWLAFAILE
jgi:hypothetical protein